MSKNNVIGIDGDLPWSLPDDRKIFEDLTSDRILIVGRRTFEERPDLAHVDHSRYCIVVSTSMTSLDLVEKGETGTILKLVPSFPEALNLAKQLEEEDSALTDCHDDVDTLSDLNCWIAGGASIYQDALHHPSAAELHLSTVDLEIDLAENKSSALFPPRESWEFLYEETSRRLYHGTTVEPAFFYCVLKKRN